MKKTIIFVEGIADLVFLKDFIEHHFIYTFNSVPKINETTKDIILIHNNQNIIKIYILGSKEALGDPNKYNLVLAEINKESYDAKLIVLDADDDFAGTKTMCNSFTDLNLTSNYVFPNNKDDGDLETILENIQADNNISNCWINFESCINNIKPEYTIPAKKSKIHTYLEILNPNTNKGKDNCKERNRNYKDTSIWNMHNLQNSYVSDLKTYLDQYLP